MAKSKTKRGKGHRKLTGKQRRRLSTYVRWVANAMDLRDWTLILVHDPPTDEAASGEVRCVLGRRVAEIRFDPEWILDRSPAEVRHTVVHELVHCQLADPHNLVQHVLPDIHGPGRKRSVLGQTGYDAFYGAFLLAIEHSVDALASTIAPHMPLPDLEHGPTKL